MLLNVDYITPAEITGYVRAALADLQINAFTLGRWLPNRLIPDLDYRFTRGGSGLVDAATFRAYDAESPIGKRPGATRVTGELPPVSRKVRLGEYDRLRSRGLNQAIRDQIESDAVAMMRQVSARLELARGEALYKGKLQINENGVVATVDFGRKAGHTVSAATAWTDFTNSTPLTNELTWLQTYIDSNGQPPAVALTSMTVVTYMLRNAEYRNIVGRNGFVPARISRADLNGIREDYGLPPIEVYDAQVNVGGVATRIIPADRLVYLPPPDTNPDTNDFGATFYGITAEALELDDITEGDEPGVVAAVYKDPDPVAIWTKAAAVALPVLANPDLSFAADVA